MDEVAAADPDALADALAVDLEVFAVGMEVLVDDLSACPGSWDPSSASASADLFRVLAVSWSIPVGATAAWRRANLDRNSELVGKLGAAVGVEFVAGAVSAMSSSGFSSSSGAAAASAPTDCLYTASSILASARLNLSDPRSLKMPSNLVLHAAVWVYPVEFPRFMAARHARQLGDGP